VHEPARILIVDDNEDNREIIRTRLATQGYDLLEAGDGEEAMAVAKEKQPDLILLDVMMPKLDGIEVCRRLKSDTTLPFTTIILVTARADSNDVVRGLEAGADEYLTKPVDQTALVARVSSMLRLKDLHDRVAAQAADLASWNRVLEQRFLSPQIAEMIVSSGNERILESHRREITVVICDLRGFTAFSETAEPEDVMAVLHAYHSRLGALIDKFAGTVERFTGDGLMVWFNDPLPCPDPCERAARMGVEMRDEVAGLVRQWRMHDYNLGFAIGIAHGYATLGQIGFERRFDYAAVGTVVNLAARLCAEASDRQILIDAKVCAAVEEFATVERIGELALKGFNRPVKAFNLTAVQ
jgi:adenylate cyclase